MGKKILVIDDDDRSRRLARDILSYRGHEVAVAGGGAEGVALASDRPPDLVLLDIQMPGSDGFATIAALRAAGISAPVVAMTASVMPSERQRMQAAGFAGYLAKPITVRSLLEALGESGIAAPERE